MWVGILVFYACLNKDCGVCLIKFFFFFKYYHHIYSPNLWPILNSSHQGMGISKTNKQTNKNRWQIPNSF